MSMLTLLLLLRVFRSVSTSRCKESSGNQGQHWLVQTLNVGADSCAGARLQACSRLLSLGCAVSLPRWAKHLRVPVESDSTATRSLDGGLRCVRVLRVGARLSVLSR